MPDSSHGPHAVLSAGRERLCALSPDCSCWASGRSASVSPPFRASKTIFALNSSACCLRFDVSDLLPAEDQQTSNRSLCQCPSFGRIAQLGLPFGALRMGKVQFFCRINSALRLTDYVFYHRVPSVVVVGSVSAGLCRKLSGGHL